MYSKRNDFLVRTCCIVIACIICFTVAVGILAGGWGPAVSFNSRVWMTVCTRYYSVRARYCIDPPQSEVFCYDVLRNTVPANATCWQSPVMATFHDRALAIKFAQSFGEWTFDCYFDPQTPCYYYDGLADTTTPIIVVIVFSVLTLLLALTVVVSSIRGRMVQDPETVALV